MVEREAVLEQHVLEHEVVEVRLVGGEEDQGVRFAEGEDLAQLRAGVVDALVRGADEYLRDVVDEVDDVGRVLGGDLLQIPLGALLHPLDRLALGVGEALDAMLERPAPEQVLFEEPGDLVPLPAKPPLGSLEGEPGLEGDVLAERGAIGGAAALRLGPPTLDLGAAGRIPDDDAGTVGVLGEDGPLLEGVRVARVPDAEAVADRDAAQAVALLRQPRDPHRHEQRIVLMGEALVDRGIDVREGSLAA